MSLASQQHKPRVLLIGPLPNMEAQKIGGARVSFARLARFFAAQKVPFDLLNTRKYEVGLMRLVNPIYFLAKFLQKIRAADVVFVNMSQGGAQKIAPFLFLCSKFFGKPFVFRPFGGGLQDHFEKYASFQKWVFRQTLLRSDIFFLQTKASLQFFSDMGGQTFHLPTSREAPGRTLYKEPRLFRKRFVFMGHIKASKGVSLLMEAVEQIEEPVVVHIYGPVKEPKYNALFRRQKRSLYKGLLAADEVLKTLREYDVLILPTQFDGEGYPGAIIEAYSLGLPVISTRWKAIPEIVQHKKTGFLISPGSVDELIEAIQFFKADNYPEISRNAHQFFIEHFRESIVLEKMLLAINRLVK